MGSEMCIRDRAKGYGLPAAGTNAAHSLPLGDSLVEDEKARADFNEATAKLHVSVQELADSIKVLNNHTNSGRVREKDHPLRVLKHVNLTLPDDNYSEVGKSVSCLAQIDHWFNDLILCNKALRFRLGNPDEIQSNRMKATVRSLKHRVTSPEDQALESLKGGVITALNEEAVASAVLANKQGCLLYTSDAADE